MPPPPVHHTLIQQQAQHTQVRNVLRLWRRHDAPPFVAVLRDAPTGRGGTCFGLFAGIDRADELAGCLKRRVIRVDNNLRQQRGHGMRMVQCILQLLLDHVADHADGFRTQHVERKCLVGFVSRTLKRQQPDLRPIAVGHDQRVPGAHDFCQCSGRSPDVGALIVCRQGLSPLQQGVPAKRCDHQHG